MLARALDGQVDTYTKADGTQVVRHRYDNRLATQLLARLDRQAEAGAGSAADHAARIVAQDFEMFLDGVERNDGPARAAMFLATREALAETPDLAAVAALSRADLYLRTGTGTARDIDIADLDPARRAEWSAEQWLRAEAAGLVALAPMPQPEEDKKPAGDSQLAQPADYPSVWWDEDVEDWRTEFPPPAGFDGEETGRFGDGDYERALSPQESEIADADRVFSLTGLTEREGALRDAWFASCAQRAGYRGRQSESSLAQSRGGSQTCAVSA